MLKDIFDFDDAAMLLFHQGKGWLSFNILVFHWHLWSECQTTQPADNLDRSKGLVGPYVKTTQTVLLIFNCK